MKTNEDEKTKEQKLAEELMIWLPKFSAGVTLQFVLSNGTTASITTLKILLDSVDATIGTGSIIRIKQAAFPNAPDQEKWQNPDNLTAEQVGIEDGWRLLLVSEIYDRKCYITAFAWGIHCGWGSMDTWLCRSKSVTYRVKASEHPVGSLKPKGEKLGGVHAKPIDRPGEMANPLKGLKVRRGIS